MNTNDEIVLPQTDHHTFKFNEFQFVAFPWAIISNVDGNGNYLLETNHYSRNTIRPQQKITISPSGNVEIESATKDCPLKSRDAIYSRSKYLPKESLSYFPDFTIPSLMHLHNDKSLRKKIFKLRNDQSLQMAQSHLYGSFLGKNFFVL